VHELGVVIEVVKTVDDFARKNHVRQIQTLVLQIGELSSMIPKYVEDCFPMAIEGTILQSSKLKIEILPGNAICSECGKVFNLLQNENVCPGCAGKKWEIISGKEFVIKEIIAC
jgi:hydrogenase nickel incorporation protein HypA/HybF